MNKEIQDGNKLIAEFMGWEFGRYSNLPNKAHKEHEGKEIGLSLSNMGYHSDWNELMPIVEKLESLYLSVQITRNNCFIHWMGAEPEDIQLLKALDKFTFIEVDGISKIDSVYKAVIKAIQWYNTNHLNKPDK